MDYAERIYEIVKKIPKGRVATYGQIAEIIQNSKIKTQNYSLKLKITPRMVGRALHNNPDPENIPCHRVVDKDGRLASGFAFGGAMEQRRRLVAEGVSFRDAMHVDLKACLWQSQKLT